MPDFLTGFATAFIPIFVAMDAIGLLPIYIGLTNELGAKERRTVLIEAIITVTALGLVFAITGRKVFEFLGITVADFMVAGGIILLILAISDLLFPEKSRQRPVSGSSVGIVPIGMPLLLGPATITTLVLHSEMVGTWVTLLAFVANLLIVLLMFTSAGSIMKVLRKAGTQAVSKIANLMLAAIAVMLIRKGLMQIISGV